MSIYKNNVLFQNKVFFLREEYGNGQGTFIYPNGWYSGEWEKGKIQGQGTFSWFNGDKYEGELGSPSGISNQLFRIFISILLSCFPVKDENFSFKGN